MVIKLNIKKAIFKFYDTIKCKEDISLSYQTADLSLSNAVPPPSQVVVRCASTLKQQIIIIIICCFKV